LAAALQAYLRKAAALSFARNRTKESAAAKNISRDDPSVGWGYGEKQRLRFDPETINSDRGVNWSSLKVTPFILGNRVMNEEFG
jgi:hypothetical protein